MTPSEALAEVHRAGASGDFYVSPHARERQGERSVQRVDLQEAMRTATNATFQSDRDTWRIDGGKDFDGDDLTVVVVFDAGVVVVTVF